MFTFAVVVTFLSHRHHLLFWLGGGSSYSVRFLVAEGISFAGEIGVTIRTSYCCINFFTACLQVSVLYQHFLFSFMKLCLPIENWSKAC